MLKPLAATACLALLLAGCVTPGSTLDPAASAMPALPEMRIEGAELVERTDTSATFSWKGTIDAAKGFPGVGLLALPQFFVPRPGPLADPAAALPFSPPLGVPFFVEATLVGESAETLGLDVLGKGFRQCTSGRIGGPEWSPDCRTRVYDPLVESEEWMLVVRAGDNDRDGLPFEMLVRVEAAPLPAQAAPPRLVAHRAAGDVAVPAAWEALAFKSVSTGLPVAEPSIGVASDGTLFTTATSDRLNPAVPGVGTPALRNLPVARSTDDGDTWELVSHPALSPKISFDPWLWLDPLTDRLYDAPLYVECSWAQWTDDGGESWDANPLAGCGLPDHDHQKITTGPPAAGVETMGYPNVVYYSYNPFRSVPEEIGTFVTVSLDGGRTWSLGAETVPGDCTGGITGGVAVAPDGTAYSAHGGCDGVLVAVSRDSGASWSAPVRAASHHHQFSNPDLAFDREGIAYMAHPDEELGVSLTLSRDAGASWESELDITPSSLRRALFPTIAVGEPGKVAISYLATTADPADWPRGGDPSYAPDATVWHSYVTFSHDALADDPTWITVRVTPDEDPVQIGCIWLHGGGAECRNLLDFTDSVQHEGRVYTARADGCDKCVAAARPQVRGNSTIEIQVAGPTLGPAWWAEGKTSSALPRLDARGVAARLV